jgi:tricorn protease interacting factor F2/3
MATGLGYRLTLTLDYPSGKYAGSVEVSLPGPVDTLSLNAAGIRPKGASVAGAPVPLHEEPEQERWTLGPFPARATTITVGFEGQVNEAGLGGLYRSRHGDGVLFTTHLAPANARSLFPCLDDPKERATVELEITTPAGPEVIFNTPLIEERREGDRVTRRFAPTPPMATYLIYLGVGHFDRYTEQEGRVTVSCLTPPGRGLEGRWAVHNARQVLREYATYYEQPYPLEKLDLVSVQDFGMGAMENWGAITFREEYLLADGSTPARSKQRIAEVVAHEIAHQWFGNLVTMARWEDIWLNESFATFVSYRLVDRLYPAWDLLGEFLSLETGGALFLDDLQTAHPIRVPLPDPKLIPEIFDAISYGKGASLLRMVEGYLGEETFRRGIVLYLREHAYGNATSEDLWDALQRVSERPVRELLRTWVERPGHPLLEVTEEAGSLTLTQRRSSLGPPLTEDPWPLPLTLSRDGRPETFLFDTRTRTLPGGEPSRWVLDPEAVAFARIAFRGPLFREVLPCWAGQPPRSRLARARDLFPLLLNGTLDREQYLAALAAFRSEPDSRVAEELLTDLRLVVVVLEDLPEVREAGLLWARAQRERFGFQARPGEGESVPVLRERLAVLLAQLDDGVARELAALFPAWDRTDPNLRSAVAIGYARTAGAEAVGPLKERIGRATTQEEVRRLVTGLMAVEDPSLLVAALDWAIDGPVGRGQLLSMLGAAALNSRGRASLWGWVRDHRAFLDELDSGSGILSRVLAYLIPLVGLGQGERVRKDLREHPFAYGAKGTREGLEQLGHFQRLRARVGAPRGSPGTPR